MKNSFSVNPAFILVWAMFIITDRSSYALCLFVCALIHEFSHVAFYLSFGAEIEKAELLPFGISIRLKSETDISCGKEILSSLAGIFANLIAAFIGLCLKNSLLVSGVDFFILCNLLLAGINLLPIVPLDGGRALYYFLLKTLSEKKAKTVCKVISVSLLIPLFLFGIYVLYITKFNFSLILICLYIIFYIFYKKEI